jgi:hypothetical protein
MDKRLKYLLAAGLTIFGILSVFGAYGAAKYGYGSPIASPVAQNWKFTTGGGGPAATTTEFIGSVTPDTNNLYDLGTPTKSWQDIYASGTAYIAACSGAGCGLTLPLGQSLLFSGTGNQYDIGSAVTSVRSIYSSSTIYGVNLSATNATSSWLGFTTASGTSINLGLTTSNITTNGANPKRTIVLTGAGAVSSFTSGAATSSQIEMATNKDNYRLPAFSGTAANYVEWTVVMPDNYDGSALSGLVSFTVTSTADTASSTVWGLAATCTSTGGSLDMTFPTAATTSKQLTAANALHTTGAISFTPTNAAGGSVCQFRASRDATDSVDTFTAQASFVAAKIEYGINYFTD